MYLLAIHQLSDKKSLWTIQSINQSNFIHPSYIVHVKHREQELNANNDKLWRHQKHPHNLTHTHYTLVH